MEKVMILQKPGFLNFSLLKWGWHNEASDCTQYSFSDKESPLKSEVLLLITLTQVSCAVNSSDKVDRPSHAHLQHHTAYSSSWRAT
jgi:hypothetical protein